LLSKAAPSLGAHPFLYQQIENGSGTLCQLLQQQFLLRSMTEFGEGYLGKISS
jgi:hypothetical protein